MYNKIYHAKYAILKRKGYILEYVYCYLILNVFIPVHIRLVYTRHAWYAWYAW